MLPRKLTMSAFGSYAEKTTIDFAKLGRSGLYLITGNTGAGKTTIFDAIVYALYGKASGENRKPEMMRSENAQKDMETFVELEFEYAGRQYRIRRNPPYERLKKRGEGTTTEDSNVTLYTPNGQVFSDNKADAKIKEIMGVDPVQFKQIAMIAQGDFMKMITTPTIDRIKIFREIFKTDIYKNFQVELKNESDKVWSELDKAKQSVSQYIEDVVIEDFDTENQPVELVVEQLREQLKRDAEAKTAIDAELTELDNKKIAIAKELAVQEEYEKNVKSLNESKIQLEQKTLLLKDLESQKQAAEACKPEQEAKTGRIAQINAVLNKYDELEKAENQLKKLETDLQTATTGKAAAEKNANDFAANLETLKTEFAQLENAAEQKVKLESEQKDIERKLTQLTALSEAQTELTSEKSKLKKWQEGLEKLILERRAKLAEYESKNELFLLSQAGILAKELKDGQPCPVCGSTHHPKTAEMPENAPTKEEVKALKVEFDKIDGRVNEGQITCTKQKTDCESLEKNVNNQIAEIFGSNAQNITDETIGNEKTATSQRLQSLKAEIVKMQTAVERRKKLNDEIIPQLQNQTDAEKKRATDLTVQISGLEAQHKASAEAIAALKKDLEFASKQAAQNEIQKLETERTAIDKANSTATENYSKCDSEIRELNGIIKGLQDQTKDGSKINKEEMQSARQQVENEINTKSQHKQKLEIRLDSNSKSLKNIEATGAKLQALQTEFQWKNVLSETASGGIKGKQKIQFETYVQMSFFDRIISRANIRFMIMSNGQYELKRKELASNNSAQSGLDLDVIDHYNGSERDVKSLSGGESFKASLSLALGLSDEIQSNAGGIQLDTMFVDEGFGSLDSDSLEQALKALNGLTEGNKLVGIISHVDALKRIDKQLIVSKDTTGVSRVELVC
ncbi:MAG: SMC family ATPase [Salinivirgaceae bacterium]|nr:SMC family ATPase [Salinivirgaceae bacterium]